MKNWKTLLTGIVLAVGIAGKPIAEKRPPTITEVIEIIGAVGLGNASKDKDVTGAGDTARRVPSGQ